MMKFKNKIQNFSSLCAVRHEGYTLTLDNNQDD